MHAVNGCSHGAATRAWCERRHCFSMSSSLQRTYAECKRPSSQRSAFMPEKTRPGDRQSKRHSSMTASVKQLESSIAGCNVWNECRTFLWKLLLKTLPPSLGQSFLPPYAFIDYYALVCYHRLTLDSMRWFSKRRRTGGRRNWITYLLMDVVTWPTATPATLRSVYWFFCVVTQQTATFWGVGTQCWSLILWPQIRLGRDFCTVHLTAKFHHPTFNRSKVILLTNEHTPLKTSTSLRYATPVDSKPNYTSRSNPKVSSQYHSCITCNYSRGIPYSSMILRADMSALAYRRENLSHISLSVLLNQYPAYIILLTAPLKKSTTTASYET